MSPIQLIIALFVAHFYLSKKKLKRKTNQSRSTLLFYIQKNGLSSSYRFLFLEKVTFFSPLISLFTFLSSRANFLSCGGRDHFILLQRRFWFWECLRLHWFYCVFVSVQLNVRLWQFTFTLNFYFLHKFISRF